MISFDFVVKRAFLSRSNRPITIPKSQVDYDRLQVEGMVGDATVVCPDGSRIPGKIYSGTAGYGPYYQLRVESGVVDPLGKLAFGTRLRVSIFRESGRTIAMVSPA